MGKFWIIISLVLANWWFCQGCWEEERFALLQLKSNINYPNGNFLPSWIDHKTSDCCEWSNVVCDTTTKRVVQLSLDSTRVWRIQGEWHFNASLFLPFKMLRALSLADNGLVGWVENQGLEKLSELSNLEVLNLRRNIFNRSVLSSLSHLTSLKSLNLGANMLKGSSYVGYGRLSNLKRLEVLYLNVTLINDSNFQSVCSINDFTNLKELYISDNTFQSIGPMHGVPNLEILHLRDNVSNNSIFSSLKQLPSLKFLDLSRNFAINGSVEVNELLALEELDLSETGVDNFITTKGLPNLEILRLEYNGFNSSIFSSCKKLPSLRFLDLYGNQAIKGSVQVNELLSLTNLEELDLSVTGVNNFVITKGIANVSHLQVLHLDYMHRSSNNNVSNLVQSLTVFASLKTLSFKQSDKLSVETHYLKKLSKLENLILDGTYLDKDVFNNIGGMVSLKVISLSNCGLSGTLPNQGWCELKNLQELSLSHNKLNGMLPSCLENLTSLRLIDLSANELSGNIAISPLSTLTSLESLTISNNHFQVPISFESFTNHSNLKFILADNNEVILETTTSSKNNVPSFQLEFFSLSNCVGQYPRLPSFLLHQNQLRILDLSHNKVGGDFPVWLLENNTNLEGFYMGGNAFKGSLNFPQKPNSLIRTIDISENNLSGQIPKHINISFPNIVVLNMSWNNLVGSLPCSFGDLKSLAYLDLSDNNLTGELPQKLATGCLALSVLKLSNNKFHGQIFPGLNYFDGVIPDILYTISFSLWALDISHNHFYGEVPKWIGNMTSLEYLSMSNNILEGPIPLELCELVGIQLLDMSNNRLSGSIPSCFNLLQGLRHLYLSKNWFGGELTHVLYSNNSYSLETLDLSDNNFRGKIPEWIDSLSALRILLLKGNYFEGIIPHQLCQLGELIILDLSHNNLSGLIPHCLGDEMTIAGDVDKSNQLTVISVITPMTDTIMSYLETSKLANAFHLPLVVMDDYGYINFVDDYIKVEFTIKLQEQSFKGIVLEYMSGIDLSCNQLIGSIPPSLGNLGKIHALNLSHNNLVGAIPTTLSGLVNVESLDLSYNMLNGRIPAQLLQLNFLEVFSVAHNNLSGPTPERKAQFATFEENSYEGNALLCGPPLSNLCTKSPRVLLPENNNEEEEGNFMDLESFYISFGISYIVMLLTVVAVLWINPYWRRIWFDFIGFYMMSCYHFVLDRFS